MASLSAFEAASRLQSFTAAATELHLTQSAVSRRVRALERALGAEVFHRNKQAISLTPSGTVYAREVGEALKRIASATLNFRGNPRGRSLNIAVPALFGARWLTPRLPSFFARNSDITINLVTSPSDNDTLSGVADATIHLGAPETPDIAHALMMPEFLVPTCAPALLSKHRFKEPLDLLSAPLIHLASIPDSWERWFNANGAQVDLVHGMLVDHQEIAIEAAAAGLGIALLPSHLIRPEIERKALAVAIDRPITISGSYYLVWPPNRGGYAPLDAFRRWVLDCARMESNDTE